MREISTAAKNPLRRLSDRGEIEPASSALASISLAFAFSAARKYGSKCISAMRGFYLLPLLFATACSHTPVAVCPAVVPYSPEQQTQVADELETLPPDAMTRTFIRDYGITRAKLRECAK